MPSTLHWKEHSVTWYYYALELYAQILNFEKQSKQAGLERDSDPRSSLSVTNPATLQKRAVVDKIGKETCNLGNNVYSFLQRFLHWATFEGNGGKKLRLRKKCCFNVPNIVPTFVPIGKYCPIIIVKGEADRDYRTRVLAQDIYVSLH
jgi:hypothetical protein